MVRQRHGDLEPQARQRCAVLHQPAGWSVAVDRSTYRLVQYRTPLPGQGFEVTVTLSDHGPRTITVPADGESVDGAAHPQVAATVGL